MTDSTAASQPSGGPDLPQERRLVDRDPRSALAGGRGPPRRRGRARHRLDDARLRRAAPAAACVVDVDGNSLIDFGSGIAVVNVGNAADAVVARVQEQVARFTHTCFMVTPYEGYVDVCEALNRLTPGDHEKRSALFNSGAEAVENAVKIARAHTGRQAVVVFDHGYHGRTNLTMALTAKNMPYKHSFGPFAPEVYRAPMSYPFRDGEARRRAGSDGAPST